MKLADWSLHFYTLPYAREVVWSNAVEPSGLFALLRLVSDDGVTGVAEGTLKGTWSGVSPRSLRAALEDLVLPSIEKVDLADAARRAGGERILARVEARGVAEELELSVGVQRHLHHPNIRSGSIIPRAPDGTVL